jgi:uncharacterized protein (UPF0276 family)
MQFALNYSLPAADFVQQGRIQIDLFKCPAWPDLITAAREIGPVYVHFPLRVGPGIKDAIDTETKRPADWARIEMLLAQTETPFVNLHLSPTGDDYPDIPISTTDPGHVELLTGCLIQDVQAVVDRFGPERVIIENICDIGDRFLQLALLPEVVAAIVRETGCGLLFDFSHARLAAHQLGRDVYEYIQALPVDRTAEIHITGIQYFGESWISRMRQAGVEDQVIQRFAGHLLDHLPLTDEDWDFMVWLMAQIRTGMIKQPRLITLEYGGVGRLFESITEAEVIAAQAPRLYALIKGIAQEQQGAPS